ncbi:unnamed protein product, partial [marine sediment metagenome]
RYYHDKLKETILDFTHEMNLKDVNIGNQEIEILKLRQHLGAAIWRLEEVWEMPEVAGDLMSFYSKALLDELELKPIEDPRDSEILRLKKEVNDLTQKGLI